MIIKTQEICKVHPDNRVIDFQTQNEWKIQLSMAINFISFNDSNEICTLCTKSNNVEIMVGE